MSFRAFMTGAIICMESNMQSRSSKSKSPTTRCAKQEKSNLKKSFMQARGKCRAILRKSNQLKSEKETHKEFQKLFNKSFVLELRAALSETTERGFTEQPRQLIMFRNYLLLSKMMASLASFFFRKFSNQFNYKICLR
jgi:hypothetical protein